MKKGRELCGEGNKRPTDLQVSEGWNMGDRQKLCQGSGMNVDCSLYSDTAELVQAVKIVASGQSLSWRVYYSSLSHKQEHQEKVVRERVSQTLSFATDTEDDLQTYIGGMRRS